MRVKSPLGGLLHDCAGSQLRDLNFTKPLASCTDIKHFQRQQPGDARHMFKKSYLLICALPLIAACQDISGTTASASNQFIAEVPEGATSIAAAGQDLTALKIDPIDGCYTYRHVGPVEDTMLPLRAKNGRPICTRASS